MMGRGKLKPLEFNVKVKNLWGLKGVGMCKDDTFGTLDHLKAE